MRQHLLGYLLGALEAQEQEEVKRELERNRPLRDELHAIRRRMGSLGAARQHSLPPEGLAARTCSFVEQYRPGVAAQAAAIGAEPPAGRATVADLIVAAGILAAATALFLPAIASSRYSAQVIACQNNLRELGKGLIAYSERFGNRHFPRVPTGGNRAFAGYSATMLWERGLVPDQHLFICPASSLSQSVEQWSVPTSAELDRARGQRLEFLHHMGGGSYGYPLGVFRQGGYAPSCNEGRSQFAVMSDTPMPDFRRRASPNHGGFGFNVLYEDGHVQYIRECRCDERWDDPFRSRRGLVEPGVDINDAVIGSSETRPPFRVFLGN